jgi:hypothetical protein
MSETTGQVLIERSRFQEEQSGGGLLLWIRERPTLIDAGRDLLEQSAIRLHKVKGANTHG